MSGAKLIGGITIIIILAVLVRNSAGTAGIINAAGGQLVGFTNAAVGA